jgi:hypothetical protein
MLNKSFKSPLIVVFTPTYHSFGKVALCLNSYKEVMKVEGGTLQMASTLTSVNNFMELIQGEVITWRSLALVVTTLVLVAIFHNVCSLIMYFWWTPRRLRGIMEKQGWKGPKTFHILVGNMHEIRKFCDEELLKDLGIRNFDIESRILPRYALYSQKYGNPTTLCYP